MILAAANNYGDGAVFTFVLLALIVGIVIGALLPRAVEEERPDDERPDYAALNAAATKAYRAAHLPIPAPLDGMLMLTWDGCDPQKPMLLDPQGFELLAGVSPKRLRELLMAP